MSARAGWVAGAGTAASGLMLALAVIGVVATAPGRASASDVAAGAACGVTAPGRGGADSPIPLDGEQSSNARVIAATARSMGMAEHGAAVGLMTAMQESSLRNLDHGDAAGPDSRGLFQQRSASYSGVDRMDPVQASRAFFQRLRAVRGWQRLPMWQASQAVQHSADGRRYERWAAFGTALARELADAQDGTQCGATAQPGLAPSPDSTGQVRTVLSAAASQLGQPYVWGGGDSDGPTGGVDEVRPPGFDCSGLAVFAYGAVGLALPHSSRSLYDVGRQVPLQEAGAGDLIFLSSNGRPGGIHHVAIVWSPGRIIEAQTFGVPVRVRAYRGPREPEILPLAVRVIA